MTKQEQFLWAVQTVLISNSINLSLEPEKALARRAHLSATGMLGTVADALYASERIPEEMSAAEAADDFCGWMIAHIREAGDTCPAWFQRH